MTKKAAKETIHAKGIDIGIYTTDFQNEYISLTDIARYKSDEPKDVVKNWLRVKDTIAFLGLWELLHNPEFKGVEFDSFKNEADVLNVALFGITARQWHQENISKRGNIRDFATINQLLVLANMESYNAILIEQGKEQSDRLVALRELAVKQLNTMESLNVSALPQIEKNND